MRLKYEAKNAWEFERENNKLDDVMNYSKGYMHFLDVGKTERTSAREIVRMAKENGYISIDEAMNNGKVNPGDKIYAVNKDTQPITPNIVIKLLSLLRKISRTFHWP